MSKSLAESALLIASMVFSINPNSQWQFAPTASPPLDFQGSVVGPPGLAETVFHMSKRHAESTVSIAAMVLSND
jgi:hypothetical protein